MTVDELSNVYFEMAGVRHYLWHSDQASATRKNRAALPFQGRITRRADIDILTVAPENVFSKSAAHMELLLEMCSGAIEKQDYLSLLSISRLSVPRAERQCSCAMRRM